MSEQRSGRFDPTTVLVVALILALIGAYALAVYLAQGLYVEAAPATSTFSSAPEGLKTAFRYVDRLGADVGVLRTFDELPTDGTIVFGAAGTPEIAPTADEIERLRRWVRQGGRLVLIGVDAGVLLADAAAAQRAPGDDVSLEPVSPSVYSQDVGAMRAGVTRLLTDEPAWVATYKDGAGYVLVSRAEGAGEIVWLADPFPLTNEGIGEADDGALAVRLLAGAPGPVWFDEYHHGYARGGGAWDKLGLGGRTALIVLLAAAGVLVVSRAQRLGPAVPLREVPAARTLAYIDSLAELYRKAGARSHALETLEDGLMRALARRHGSAEAGLARHSDAREAIGLARAARGQGEIGLQEFIDAAARLRRVRCGLEGHR